MSTTTEAYDVAVIGAGLAGALTARRLADAGQRVVILESRDLPGGLNLHSAGLALLGTAEPYSQLHARVGADMASALWALTRENLHLLAHTLQNLQVDYQRCGSRRDVENGEAEHKLLQCLDYGITLDETGAIAVLHTQDDIMFSSADLIAALLSHPSITLETRAEVQAIRSHVDDPALLAIWARQRYLWAKTAVLTGGAYAVHLNNDLRNIIHARHIHTATVQCPATVERPTILNAGQVIVTPRGDTNYITAQSQHGENALSLIVRAAQRLNLDGPVIARHSGWVAESNDDYPVVGTLDDMPNVYHLNGLGFWGTSWVFLAVERLINLMLQQQDPGEFAIKRFSSA